MLKEILSPEFVPFETLINRIRQTDVCYHGYRFTDDKDKYNFYFAHCAYIPSLNLIAFIIFELLTVMS